MEMLERLGVVCICLVVALFLTHGTATANTVYGQNSYLSGGQGELSDMFVPFIPGTSGVLGELAPAPPPGQQGQVGLFSETIVLGKSGTIESIAYGSVDFAMQFDLSELLGHKEFVDPNSVLRLDLYDIDFEMVAIGNRVNYFEELTLKLFQDASDLDKDPNTLPYTLKSVKLDKFTYQDYYDKGDDPNTFVPPEYTDDTTISYEIKLDELIDPNAWDAYVTDMLEDKEIAVFMQLESVAVNMASRPTLFFNTQEAIDCSMSVSVMPEPGAMILLTCGAAALLLRRRR